MLTGIIFDKTSKNMKNLILFILFFGIALPASAQRFGYVDTDYILENLPQYNQAQQRLKTQTEQWNQEIQNRQDALNKKQADFLNEKVLLTDDQIKKEQEDIDKEIKEIKDLQEKRYGQNGDLINLRKALVKPIQDQVWIAVKEVAEKRNYGFVFDKGSDLIMVYTDPKFDISREVLLQLNPNALDKGKPGKNNNSGNTRSPSNNSPKPNAKSGNKPGKTNSPGTKPSGGNKLK
jgi:outer membrane protein